jgi:3-oxoacyl-[acyl-carrier-protein] synthase-1
VVAIGARTPVGLTAETSAAAVRAGISRVREHPFIIDMGGNPRVMAFDSRLATTSLGWRRLASLAESALGQTLSHLDSQRRGDGPIPVLLALPESRPGFSDSDARQTASALTNATPSPELDLRFEILGRGHAGALQGLQAARERLVAGRCQLCVVGGVESYLESDTLDWLETEGRLKAKGIRNGFTPGEGAGFVILATRAGAAAYGLSALATLRGAGVTSEPCHINSGAEKGEVLGHGLSAAIEEAAAELRLPVDAVSDVYCDINGERYRAEEWGFATLRMYQALGDSACQTPATCWGDVGAASGILGCILAMRAWARGYAQGPRALVWGSSDGGLRGAVILDKETD